MCDWPALDNWKHVQWWKNMHGHRTVPLEIGRYGWPHWREALGTISDFMDSYMTPSIVRDSAFAAGEAECGLTSAPTTAQDLEPQRSSSSHAPASRCGRVAKEAGEEEHSDVAYIAQHRIFDQIPQLLEDLSEPTLWRKGYEVMNMWMGTRGTVRLCYIVDGTPVCTSCETGAVLRLQSSTIHKSRWLL